MNTLQIPPENHGSVLDKVPDALALLRIVGTGEVMHHLDSTMPEDRTWQHGAATAALASTDKLDGWWARRFGSSEMGPKLDVAADIIFTLGNQLALAKNGELPAIYPILKIGREIGVNAMRLAASKDGNGTIPVDNRGRQKTVLEMLLIVAANSPVSMNPDAMRSIASYGSALSASSGISYGLQYASRGRQTDAPKAETSARNGLFRRAFASPNDQAAKFVHERFPAIQPHHLTHFGEFLVEASAIMTLVKPEWGFPLAAGPYTAGGLIDGIDGKHARLKGVDGIEGMKTDVLADRRQELVTFIINSLNASRNGNKVAATSYAIGAMTAALPSLFRSLAESKGYLVSEDAVSSRVPRAILNGAGLAFNGNQETSNIVSAMLASGNAITAAERADVARRGKASPHYRGSNTNPEFMKEAAIRRDALMPIALAGLAIGSALLVREHADTLGVSEKISQGKQKIFRAAEKTSQNLSRRSRVKAVRSRFSS